MAIETIQEFQQTVNYGMPFLFGQHPNGNVQIGAALNDFVLWSWESEISDNTEDSGFHIAEDVSIEDLNGGTSGHQAFSQFYLLFKNLPDLTGKNFKGAILRLTADEVYPANNREDADKSYVAAIAGWDESSNVATMQGLSLGSDTGIDITNPAAGGIDIDLTVPMAAIYAADDQPDSLTISFASAYWLAALTEDSVDSNIGIGDVEDYIDLGDGMAFYDDRSIANTYPRLTIYWEKIITPAVSGTYTPTPVVTTAVKPKFVGNVETDVRTLWNHMPCYVTLTTPAQPGQELAIPHGLGRVPNGWCVIKGDPGTWTSHSLANDTAWNNKYLYVKFAEPSRVITIAIF